MSNNNGLGRGLGSLIPQKSKPTSIIKKERNLPDLTPGDKILKIDPEIIDANPLQPRKKFTDYKLDELVDSIKEFGVIQPIIVTEIGDRYELIAGERRLRASKLAGLKEIPAILRKADEKEKLEVALIENIQREELNPIDLALAYKQLAKDFNMTQEDVAKKVGKSRSSVTNAIRLLNLPEEIQLALIDGKISEGHAKYLIGLDNEVKQMSLYRKILNNKMTVGDTNKELKKMGGTKAARVKINYADKDKEFAFREFFGAKTEVRRKGGGGQVIMDFYNDEELAEMVEKIKK